MAKKMKQDEGLFLLEVLIDKIVFVKSPCFTDKDFRTCVNIECPAVEPLEICDDDPGVCVAKSGGPFVKTFNSGKSCLFSLKESDISSAMSKFPIKVSVYKSLPCGCLPTKIVMGEATIDMTKEFVEARKKFLEDPTTVSYQALKDSFRIVGPDGGETGEIVMFLRISCFGKLIITRFQGTGGPPNLGAGGGSAIVDRSCQPRKDFQTTQDPCACGTARSAAAGSKAGSGGPPCAMGGGGGGHGAMCPIARDPYNSVPCEDPDDVCYCSGPKPSAKAPMACRNTDQYCLHVPKGVLPRLPFCQELSEERKLDIKICSMKQRNYIIDDEQSIQSSRRTQDKYLLTNKDSQAAVIVEHCLKIFFNNLKLPSKCYKSDSNSTYSHASFNSLQSKKRSVSFFDSVNSIAWPQCSYSSVEESTKYNNFFSNNETTVYNMAIFDEFCRIRCSGTQATASVNKCLQVRSEYKGQQCIIPFCNGKSNFYSSSSMSTQLAQDRNRSGVLRHSDVYFFGRKKKEKTGMGILDSTDSKTKLNRSGKHTGTSTKRKTPDDHNPASKSHSTHSAQTAGGPAAGANERHSTGSQARVHSSGSVSSRKPSIRGSTAGTCTGKAVSIKDDKVCPAGGCSKGGTDMVATISHIRIGPPNTPCPVHGPPPCQSPKCIVASPGNEEPVPVKVTTVTNPRRGVFELVIRSLTGAPLARNELMLEWTPPPSRPPPCGSPCAVACSPSGTCRPTKCRMIVCRPSKCKPKCKKGCKRPCGPPPCKKCRSCKPCPPPPKCRPCPPSPCVTPCSLACCKSPCGTPCRSSPCLRPCPVGRRRGRRSRSQPRMKAHKTRISPCWNRSNACPVVKCRSIPGPCIGCCGPPQCCPPRRSPSPWKPPKCCKSSCSTCCG